MQVDIGRVFTNSFAILRQRFLSLLGVWGVFFGASIALFMVLGFGMGGAAFMGAGADLENAGAFGAGFIILILLFYVGYFYINGAQQCAMVAMATPLEKPSFSDALNAGLRGGLTFMGVLVLILIAYLIGILLLGLVGAVMTMLGDIGAALFAILILPVLIYLACRLVLVVPVIAVDRTYNPINALSRSWQLTGGNVLRIFVVLVVLSVGAFVVFGALFGVLFGIGFSAGFDVDNPAAGVGGMVAAFAVGLLLLFPLYILFSLFASTVMAALHAEVSDSSVQELGETFG